MTPDYVRSLPLDDFNDLWLAITTIEAQDMLSQISVNSYPHTNDQSRKKLIAQLEKKAYPFKNKTKTISNKELFKILSQR